MANDVREVMKYELDITDVEVKTSRMAELQKQIAEGRGKGEDTSELEGQLGREAEALAKVTGGTKKAADGSQELQRVVGLLSQGLGAGGDALAEVVLSLGKMGGAALAGAAALLGVSAAIERWKELKGIIKEAERASEDYANRQYGLLDQRMGRQAGIDAQLRKFGVADEAHSTAAHDIDWKLRKEFGFDPGSAANAAAVASAAGIGNLDDVAVIATAAQRGVDVSTPDAARRLMGMLRGRGLYDKFLEQARAGAGTVSARQIRESASAESHGVPEQNDLQSVFEQMKNSGELPSDIATFGDFKDYIQRVENTRFAQRRLRMVSAVERNVPFVGGAGIMGAISRNMPGAGIDLGRGKEVRTEEELDLQLLAYDQIQERLRRTQQDRLNPRGPRVGDTVDTPAASPNLRRDEANIQIINNILNAGTARFMGGPFRVSAIPPIMKKNSMGGM